MHYRLSVNSELWMCIKQFSVVSDDVAKCRHSGFSDPDEVCVDAWVLDRQNETSRTSDRRGVARCTRHCNRVVNKSCSTEG